MLRDVHERAQSLWIELRGFLERPSELRRVQHRVLGRKDLQRNERVRVRRGLHRVLRQLCPSLPRSGELRRVRQGVRHWRGLQLGDLHGRCGRLERLHGSAHRM